MSAKVSILVPLYNSEKWIGDTINCLLAQTHSNIEIIVVDDHSTDNSFEIVSQLNSDKIKLVKNPKKGACSARNYGFSISTGDYIQYLDADDIIDPDKIKSQIELFEVFGNEIITFGRWARFYDSIEDVSFTNESISKDYDDPINLLVDCWNEKGMIPVHSWLTPSHLIKKAGVWNESLAHNQDGEFFSRVLMHAKALKFCPEAKCYYRSGIVGSISSGSKTEKQVASQLLSYQLIVANVSSYLSDINVRKALGNNFLNFIYRFYHLHPNLVNLAEIEFYKLKFKKMWPVGGKNFRIISTFIGFRNALKIKSLIN